MTIGIITILAALIPFVVWLVKRGIQKHSSPEEKHKERYEQIDQAIANRNSEAATIDGTDDLDDLERLQKYKGLGDPGQSGGGIREKGPGV